MDLVKLDKSIPIKAIPEQELNSIILTQFTVWVANLLSLTDETSAERLETALPAIKEHCWSMGFDEIKKMFEMYVDNKLNIEPIPNYFDRILLGKISSAYKQQKKTKPKKIDEDSYKAEQDYIHVVSVYDHFISTKKIGEESVWIYSYLTDVKKVVEFDKGIRKELFKKHYEKLPKQEAITESKLELLKDYFTKLHHKNLHIKNLIQ